MVQCPKCEVLLYRRKFGGVELEGCPACGGSWFDSGELKALVSNADELRAVDRTFRPGLQPASKKPSPTCPKCSIPLVEMAHPSLPEVTVDACRGCRGIFLDHGEPTEIADRRHPRQPGPSPVDEARARHASDATRTTGLPIMVGRDSITYAGSSLGRAFRFFFAALAIAYAQPRVLIPLAVSGTVALLLGAALLVKIGPTLLELESLEIASDQEIVWLRQLFEWLPGGFWGLVAVVATIYFVLAIIKYIIMGMTVNLVDSYLKGLPLRVTVALRDVAKNILGVVALAVVDTAVALFVGLTKDSKRQRHIVLMIVTGILHMVAKAIEAVWTVLSFLLLPIIIIEDVGLRKAMKRAKEIHSGGLLPIVVGEVSLQVVAMAWGLGIMGLVALIGWGRWPLDGRALLDLMALFLVLETISSVIFAYVRGAYYTCLYLWAAEREREPLGYQALVPGPLAEAFAA